MSPTSSENKLEDFELYCSEVDMKISEWDYFKNVYNEIDLSENLPGT